MQRYFIDYPLNQGDLFELDSDDNHHVMRVMRGKIADKINVVDSNQLLYLAEIEEVIDSIAQFRVKEIIDPGPIELPINVTIATGLSKNDKIDFIVQKGTECGMSQFIPLALKRDVVKWKDNKITGKITRLQKISKEAAEQAHRMVIPDISPLISLKELIEISKLYTYKLVAYEEVAKKGEVGTLKQILRSVKPDESLLIVFGSEGGLDPEEIAEMEAANFELCSLGPRILRAETAPIYVLSAISYEIEL